LKISGGKREGKMRAAIVIGILFMMMASLGAATVDSAELGWGGPAHNYYNLKGMYGNVSEWCNDFVGPYEWGTFVNPIGPAWTSDTAKQHVIRGGNWGSTIFYLRGANRYFYVPAGADKDVFIGFRTVRVFDGEL
jgi:formylglycine-generating enzyme required for sulfatase activity